MRNVVGIEKGTGKKKQILFYNKNYYQHCIVGSSKYHQARRGKCHPDGYY